MQKRTVLTFVKLAFGIALLLALLSAVDLHVLFDRIRSADLRYVAIMFLLPHFGILLSTYKWQILLNCTGNFFSFARLFRLYLIGTFASNFLPTMVGGDVIRTYALCRDTKEHAGVLGATFMERFIGLAALVTFLFLVFNQPLIVSEFPAIGMLVGTILIAFLAMLILVIAMDSTRWDHSLEKHNFLRKVISLLVQTHVHVQRFGKFKVALAKSYAISMVFYAVAVTTTWFAAKSLMIDVDFMYLAAAVPLVLVATIVPVSLNGLGVTEAGFVLFLQMAGADFVDALGVALLLRARVVITAIIGGVVFLFYKPINFRSENWRTEDLSTGA